MATVFHVRLYGRFIEIKSKFLERNLIELIKAPYFFKAVLAIELMQEPQSNLEENYSSGILKNDFSSRANPTIFKSITPQLLDQ